MTQINYIEKEYEFDRPNINITYPLVSSINDLFKSFGNFKGIIQYNSDIINDAQKILNEELMSWKNKNIK